MFVRSKTQTISLLSIRLLLNMYYAVSEPDPEGLSDILTMCKTHCTILHEWGCHLHSWRLIQCICMVLKLSEPKHMHIYTASCLGQKGPGIIMPLCTSIRSSLTVLNDSCMGFHKPRGPHACCRNQNATSDGNFTAQEFDHKCHTYTYLCRHYPPCNGMQGSSC